MLYDDLIKYSQSGIYPFHMPGHKRIDINSDSIIPYKIDITEITDFDNLHAPEGKIKDIERLACSLYGVSSAFALVNGSTCGILAAIRAMTKPFDRVIIARNCHKSVYNAAELCMLRTEYLSLEYDKSYGFCSGITPESVERKLSDCQDAGLVVITSPTYEGVVSDIASVAKICRRHGTRLLVDEAHGAHFPFDKSFPDEAVACGADAAVLSLHKTLPSLTQTALLICGNPSLEDRLRTELSVFETSSPSYLLLSSIERCLRFVKEGEKSFASYAELLTRFYEKLSGLRHLKVVGSDSQISKLFFDFDIGKVLISARYSDISGALLARMLRERYKIETELASCDYVIAMTSVCDTEEGFDRLCNALLEIDSGLSQNKTKPFDYNIKIPIKKYEAFELVNCKAVTKPLCKAEGDVSAEYAWVYPPGVPFIVPGEIISGEIIETVTTFKRHGLNVMSSKKNLPESVAVCEI